MAFDANFPICASCGMRGSGVRWYHVTKGGRFGECTRCKVARTHEDRRNEYLEDRPPDNGPWIV